MKINTFIILLTIYALFFMVDGSRYMRDESGNDRFGTEYDDGNGSAVRPTPGFKRSRSSGRTGKLNDSDGDENDFPESGPPKRDFDENDENGPSERGPSRRGPPGRGCPGRGPPGRGSPGLDDDSYINDDEDKSGNYGRSPRGRGPPRRGPPGRGSPNFNDDDYVNDGNKHRSGTESTGNGDNKRFGPGYDNSENGGRNDGGGNEKLRRG